MKSNDIFTKNWAAIWVSSFFLIIAGQANSMAQDAELIAIGKEIFYSQDSAAGAVLEEFDPYSAFAFIGENSPGSILANPVPTLTPPGLSPIELEFEEDGWNTETDVPDKATLDLEAPNGTYTINFMGATSGPVSGMLTHLRQFKKLKGLSMRIRD